MTRATPKESRWIRRCVERGCIVCRNLGYGPTPAEWHHIREHTGAGQKSGNALGFGLCPQHHRLGGVGVAYHAAPQQWEALYGNQLDLLNQNILENAL